MTIDVARRGARRLLLFFEAEAETKPPEALIGGRRVLGDFRMEQVLIGPDDELAPRVILAETASDAIPALPGADLLSRAIVLRPRSVLRDAAARLFVRAASLFPVDEAEGEMEPESMAGGGVHPTAEQLERYFARDRGEPPYMLNLLSFREPRAYHRYGKVALRYVARYGGGVELVSRVPRNPEGKRRWDEVALIRYPTRQAFRRMITRRAYQRAAMERYLGLLDTRLYVLSPR